MNTQNGSMWMTGLVGLGSLVFSLTACDAGDAVEQDALAAEAAVEITPLPVRDDAEQPVDEADEGAGIIAEIAVGEGGSVRFIDESLPDGTPSVGMLTVDLPELLAGVREFGLTPLEVHMALAPEVSPPELLRQHHRFAAEARGLSVTPRQVQTDDGSGALVEEFTSVVRPVLSVGTYAMSGCTYTVQPNSLTWAGNYCNNIAGGYDACGAGVVSGKQTAHTGVASQNFLGACTPSTNLTFRVERNISSGLWTLVTQITLTPGHAAEYENDDQSLLLNHRSIMTPALSGVDYQWGAARD